MGVRSRSLARGLSRSRHEALPTKGLRQLKGSRQRLFRFSRKLRLMPSHEGGHLGADCGRRGCLRSSNIRWTPAGLSVTVSPGLISSRPTTGRIFMRPFSVVILCTWRSRHWTRSCGGSAPHLPPDWRSIGVGDLVVANQSQEDGWYDVVEQNGEMFTFAGVTTHGNAGSCAIGFGLGCSTQGPTQRQAMANR
jgi:hypothetical protein